MSLLLRLEQCQLGLRLPASTAQFDLHMLKHRTQTSGRWSAMMRRALLTQTHLASLMALATAVSIFLLTSHECTVIRAIHTNCHSWCPRCLKMYLPAHWAGEGKARWGQHFSGTGIPTMKKNPCATWSSWDFHSFTVTMNWPETFSLLNSDRS